MLNRRTVLVALGASTGLATTARAQAWKARYPEIVLAVVPAENASGVTDRMGPFVAYLSRELGTKVTLSEAIPTEPAVCDANEYVLKLTVTDCTGAAVSDTVTYTVNCCGIEAAAAR
jgi:broad specificity polyphosphatase/5'/3'-nucleotidase SurE